MVTWPEVVGCLHYYYHHYQFIIYGVLWRSLFSLFKHLKHLKNTVNTGYNVIFLTIILIPSKIMRLLFLPNVAILRYSWTFLLYI